MKKISSLLTLLAMIALLVLMGCSRNRVIRGMTVEERMNRGNSLFERGKYSAAREFYESIVYDRTTVFTSTAQMRLADCYYHMNKFTEARFEYEELIRLFPDFKEVTRAYFMIGVCYWESSLPAHYTQEDTNNAKASFQLFVEKFPHDERIEQAKEYVEKCDYRLLEKKYWNGYTYYKIHDYSAAELYFNEVIAVGMTDRIDRQSLYYSCRIHIRRADVTQAEIFYQKLQSKYPNAKETKNIEKRLAKLKK
jgi:outer membrane protein assembly factor BamD